jgi:hypothetical protein|tara:strand:- start:663 stop:923 length:261 start_codon:yes stop_codon:yes gene_type:complete
MPTRRKSHIHRRRKSHRATKRRGVRGGVPTKEHQAPTRKSSRVSKPSVKGSHYKEEREKKSLNRKVKTRLKKDLDSLTDMFKGMGV